jgi:hypothetical protein
MINHYGNWTVDGVIGIGQEISGGYTLPISIGSINDVLTVTVDISGAKHLEFKDLHDEQFDILSSDTEFDSNHNYVVLEAGVSTITLPVASTLNKKSFKVSNLSGGSVTFTSPSLIDGASSYLLPDDGKVEIRSENNAWWIF